MQFLLQFSHLKICQQNVKPKIPYSLHQSTNVALYNYFHITLLKVKFSAVQCCKLVDIVVNCWFLNRAVLHADVWKQKGKLANT